jgi:hypothetical protein
MAKTLTEIEEPTGRPSEPGYERVATAGSQKNFFRALQFSRTVPVMSDRAGQMLTLLPSTDALKQQRFLRSKTSEKEKL